MKSESVRVVSPCYYATAGPAKLLTDSCEQHGVPITLYGVGEEYKGYVDAKMRGLAEVLPSITEEIVVMADARDALIVRDRAAIRQAVERVTTQQGADLVFSSDARCFPYPDLAPRCDALWHQYGEDSPFRYLCAGVFAGRRAALQAALAVVAEHREDIAATRSQMTPQEEADDQGWWTLAILGGWVKAALDYQCELAVSVKHTSLSAYTITSDLFRVRATGQHPAVIHLNGVRARDRKLSRQIVAARGAKHGKS